MEKKDEPFVVRQACALDVLRAAAVAIGELESLVAQIASDAAFVAEFGAESKPNLGTPSSSLSADSGGEGATADPKQMVSTFFHHVIGHRCLADMDDPEHGETAPRTLEERKHCALGVLKHGTARVEHVTEMAQQMTEEDAHRFFEGHSSSTEGVHASGFHAGGHGESEFGEGRRLRKPPGKGKKEESSSSGSGLSAGAIAVIACVSAGLVSVGAAVGFIIARRRFNRRMREAAAPQPSLTQPDAHVVAASAPVPEAEAEAEGSAAVPNEYTPLYPSYGAAVRPSLD